jgi:hypothetical protein
MMKWKHIIDSIVLDLEDCISSKNIKPFSLEEKIFIEYKGTIACKNFCNSHLISAPCEVTLISNNQNFIIKLDEETTKKLKDRGLYE